MAFFGLSLSEKIAVALIEDHRLSKENERFTSRSALKFKMCKYVFVVIMYCFCVRIICTGTTGF